MGSSSRLRPEFVRVLRARFRVAPWAAILVSAAVQTTTQPDRAVRGQQRRSQKQATEEPTNNPPEGRYHGTLQRPGATREQWSNGVVEYWKRNSFHYSSTLLLQYCDTAYRTPRRRSRCLKNERNGGR